MFTPKVSILIPMYNSEKHISETIKSCLNQTYKNIEIIIVDDGSTDTSLAIAGKYQAENNRIKVFSQNNKGACAARNFAFKKSGGEYIQYLDADDLLHPDKIEEQIKLASNEQAETVFSGKWDRFYQNTIECKFPKRNNYKSYLKPTDWFYDTWAKREMAQTSVWLTHRSLIEKSGGWNENLTINQDGEFFTRIILLSNKIVFSENSKIFYRSGNQNNLSNPKNNKAESLLNSLLLNEENLLKYTTENKIKEALAVKYAEYIYRFYINEKIFSQKAFERLNLLNQKINFKVGGKIFNILSAIAGFKTALIIRKYLKK